MNSQANSKMHTPTKPAPEDEDGAFLEAIQDPEKRAEVIAILKRAGSIPL